mmetsp:Transcript_53298/g.125207  ORF Transcript_53298/g.125207 Transcript_53298/m.125207 type:complete len:292 (-) Transcript_53298:420-1295(-)
MSMARKLMGRCGVNDGASLTAGFARPAPGFCFNVAHIPTAFCQGDSHAASPAHPSPTLVGLRPHPRADGPAGGRRGLRAQRVAAGHPRYHAKADSLVQHHRRRAQPAAAKQDGDFDTGGLAVQQGRHGPRQEGMGCRASRAGQGHGRLRRLRHRGQEQGEPRQVPHADGGLPQGRAAGGRQARGRRLPGCPGRLRGHEGRRRRLRPGPGHAQRHRGRPEEAWRRGVRQGRWPGQQRLHRLHRRLRRLHRRRWRPGRADLAFDHRPADGGQALCRTHGRRRPVACARCQRHR